MVYNLSRETEGARNCAADLRLNFRICKKSFFMTWIIYTSIFAVASFSPISTLRRSSKDSHLYNFCRP